MSSFSSPLTIGKHSVKQSRVMSQGRGPLHSPRPPAPGRNQATAAKANSSESCQSRGYCPFQKPGVQEGNMNPGSRGMKSILQHSVLPGRRQGAGTPTHLHSQEGSMGIYSSQGLLETEAKGFSYPPFCQPLGAGTRLVTLRFPSESTPHGEPQTVCVPF